MTVADILQRYNTDRPNQVDDQRKINWIRDVEWQVIREVIGTHDGPHEDIDNWRMDGTTLYIDDTAEEDRFDDFGENTELLIPEPYTNVYYWYIDQQIALVNNDTRRYNTAMTMFNNAYLTYQQWYNRTHKPIRHHGYLFNHRRMI